MPAGLSDDWRRARVAVLVANGPRAVLTAAQCGELTRLSLDAAAAIDDAIVKRGLQTFAGALACKG